MFYPICDQVSPSGKTYRQSNGQDKLVYPTENFVEENLLFLEACGVFLTCLLLGFGLDGYSSREVLVSCVQHLELILTLNCCRGKTK